MLKSGGYKNFAHLGMHIQQVEQAKQEFIKSHCQFMTAKMGLSQNLSKNG